MPVEKHFAAVKCAPGALGCTAETTALALLPPEVTKQAMVLPSKS